MEPEAFLVGRQVGDFRLVEVLGEGGMGIAYRAEQLVLGREAVVKVLSTPARSELGKQRFLREARLASRLDHPYAAHVYAFGAETDGLLWIAMELVRGIPLDRLIEDQGALPLARFVPLFDRLCEVVHTAHEQGIIHRDIKPANVMVVRRAGRLLPKLLDFGIARDLGREPDPGERDVSPLSPNKTRTDRAGSPGYMAPETWVDPSLASARSDGYSLAVTAYEALTCRRLFTGKTLLEVAQSHARAEIPPLGPAFPAGLDRVFKRALAKRPDERYANVLELATAMRDATRAAATTTAVDLDEAVRDTFVTSGPQPLAEAMVALAGARGEAKAWDAAWGIVDVLVRVVGVVALATRIRVGEKLDAASATHLRALVERGLGTDEWLDLIGALVAPFAERAMAYPLPELVTAFAEAGDTRRLLRELRALRDGERDARSVQAVVAELAKVLRGCTFLTDYTWVAAIEGGEAWMGPRRRPRAAAAAPPGAPPGSVWLLDRDGAPVVELSPFVHVAPPSPGADDELFLVEGPTRHGVRCVAWPREFERYDEALRAFLAEQHGTTRSRRPSGEHADATPYRGLASFGQGDASMFFGREREVEAVVNRLRVQPLIVVVGPSGVGKSSFVHAGVLPALPDAWQPITLRPGPLPLAALETRLASAGVGARGLADQIRLVPDTLRRALDDAAHREGSNVVIVIDQLEEMFTQCRDVATRDAFARALAVASAEGSTARVILTLRDDFLVRTAELPALGPRLNTSLELVTLPDPGALERILVSPLGRVGYKFESDKMPEEMIAEVREHPGALALLSFAASKLWDLRDRGFRHIPRRAYASVGGVVGALAKHAEDTLAEMTPEHRTLVRELFRHLVTSEGTRAALSRAEAIQLLGKAADAERVIEILVERRLIVAFETDDKAERIEVIHEALLSAWPRLVAWQREDAESARMRDQVRSAARQWGERGRPKGLLWRGEALLELKLWRARQGGGLTDLELAFVTASTAEEARSRRLRRLALAAVVVGLSIGLVVLQRASRIAERNAAASRRSELAMLVEQGRTELVAGDPQEAMVYLTEAYARGAADDNLPFMLGAGRAALAGQLLVMRSESLGIKFAAATPDGTRIISADIEGWVRVWNAQTGAVEHSIRTVPSVTLSSLPVVIDDRRLLTWGKGMVPTVWDLATGAPRYALPVNEGAAAAVSADADLVLTFAGTTLQSWSATDGTPRGQVSVGTAAARNPTLRVSARRVMLLADGVVWVGPADLSSPPVQIATVAFTAGMAGTSIWLDPTGRHVTAIDGRRTWVWDVEAPGTSRILAGHSGEVRRAVFSPDGTQVATLGADRSIKIWDTATGAVRVSLDGHDSYVGPGAWSPDGTRLVTGSADHTVRVWDARTGGQIAVFFGHTATVVGVNFDATGDRVIGASNDGTVRVFDARRDRDGLDLDHAGPLTLVRRGTKILVVAHDARAWLYDHATKQVVTSLGPYAEIPRLTRSLAWRRQSYGDLDDAGTRAVIPAGNNAMVIRIDDPQHPRALVHDARVTCARFAPDGRVVTATEDGKVVIWSATGARERDLVHGKQTIADLAFEPGTTRFAVASGDGVTLYDLASTAPPPRPLPSLVSDTGLAFFAEGRALAASGDDTMVRVAEVATGALRFGIQGRSAMNGLALSPDTRRIFTANHEGSVGIYDSVNGRLLGLLGDPRDSGWVTGIATIDDEVISADDLGQLRWWRVPIEARTPAEVSRETSCTIPLALVANRLVPRVLPERCP